MIYSRNGGFVALISVILISAILLVFIFTLGVSSFFNRFNVLDAENKRISLGLAEACVNTALIKLAQDSSYTVSAPGECVSVGDTCGASTATRVCKICEVSTAGIVSTIEARAVYGGAYTNLEVSISSAPSNFTVNSWEEVATGPMGCTVP